MQAKYQSIIQHLENMQFIVPVQQLKNYYIIKGAKKVSMEKIISRKKEIEKIAQEFKKQGLVDNSEMRNKI